MSMLLCWACSEPRDESQDFCIQCGAGAMPVKSVEEVVVTEAVEDTVAIKRLSGRKRINNVKEDGVE